MLITIEKERKQIDPKPWSNNYGEYMDKKKRTGWFTKGP